MVVRGRRRAGSLPRRLARSGRRRSRRSCGRGAAEQRAADRAAARLRLVRGGARSGQHGESRPPARAHRRGLRTTARRRPRDVRRGDRTPRHSRERLDPHLDRWRRVSRKRRPVDRCGVADPRRATERPAGDPLHVRHHRAAEGRGLPSRPVLVVGPEHGNGTRDHRGRRALHVPAALSHERPQHRRAGARPLRPPRGRGQVLRVAVLADARRRGRVRHLHPRCDGLDPRRPRPRSPRPRAPRPGRPLPCDRRRPCGRCSAIASASRSSKATG